MQTVAVGELRLLVSNPVKNSIILANQILIVNLASADFLMGIYLCCISAYAYLFSGKYCATSLTWLTGSVTGRL